MAGRGQAGGPGKPMPVGGSDPGVCLRGGWRAPDRDGCHTRRATHSSASPDGVSDCTLGRCSLWRLMKFPATLPIPEEVLEIARKLEQAGYEAWCVGGALRDALLGDPHSDYDLATSATPDEVQALFRRTAAVGLKYGTVGVLDRHRTMHEVTTFRRDVSTDGRHAVVAYGVALDDDLARRDFTINAIAYHPLRHEWRDPFGGADDLERGVLRAVGDPAQRFREDYLRVLRALRFAARFGFAIEPDTWKAAHGAAPGLIQLSAERVRDEWFKGLRTARSLTDLVSLWTA